MLILVKNTREVSHGPARNLFFVTWLFIFMSMIWASPASAKRYWCHDHSLYLASKGKEKQIGTGPNTLRDKLQYFYHYQKEKTFPNLSALMSSGYQLKPGQVIFFGEAHSGYVESPGVIQHYFGRTYASAKALHWTLDKFYHFSRTAKKTDPTKPVKTVYPMRGKVIEVWTDTTQIKKEAEIKLKQMEKVALDFLDFLKKPKVKKAALIAVTINEITKKWWDSRRMKQYESDAEQLKNACEGRGDLGLKKDELNKALAEMKSASDIILEAHDQVKKNADAACKTSDKNEADQYLKQARTYVEKATQQSGRLTSARIKLNTYNFSKLFESYKRMEVRHQSIARDLLNLSAMTGVNFMELTAGRHSYSLPDGYDKLIIFLAHAKGSGSTWWNKLYKAHREVLQVIRPFAHKKNWAAKIKAKADALYRKTNSIYDTVSTPLYKVNRNMQPDNKFPVVLALEAVIGEALKKCVVLDPIYEKYKEVLSYYDPAKIFVERTLDHYARALDCRDKLSGKKKSVKSVLRLSGKASSASVKKDDVVSFIYTVKIGDHAAVSNIHLQDSVCGVVTPSSGDTNGDGKLDKTETWVYKCKFYLQDDTDNRIHVSGTDESGDPVMASLLLQVKVELTEEEKKKKEKKSTIRMLWIEPLRSTIKTEEKVTFSVSLVFEDGSEKKLSPSEVKWEPGPGNTFSSKEAGMFLVNAWYGKHRAIATVNVEEGQKRTKWDKPISHADDKKKKTLPAPPDAFTWYALCEKNTGEVSYSESINAARYKVLGGPFAGPRTAKDWIKKYYPSWRCPTTGVKGQWNILCNKQNYTVAIGKTVDPTRYWIMQGGFVSEKDARSWVSQNCSSWACSQGGACSSQPRSGGDWAVVCSKGHGGIGLTKNPDPTKSWIFASGLLAEKDARLWVELRCPSWRCNRDGQCMTGIPRRTKRKPLEIPPEFKSPFSAGNEVDADKMVLKPRTTQPKRDSGYEFGRRIGDLIAKKYKEKYQQPRAPASSQKPSSGVTWKSNKADCSAERKQFNERANRMVEQAKKLNCEKGNRYSGCALDVVGPFFPYWPDKVFTDEACAKPGYKGCASGAFSAYIGCLDGCNAAWRSGNKDLKGCGQRCYGQMKQAMQRCSAR